MIILQTHFLEYFLIITVMFFVGVFGIVLNRTNILAVLMSLEISLLSISLNFILFSLFLDDIMGQIFALFIIVVAACESSIGFAIVLFYFRVHKSIYTIDVASLLRS